MCILQQDAIFIFKCSRVRVCSLLSLFHTNLVSFHHEISKSHIVVGGDLTGRDSRVQTLKGEQ